MEITVSSFLSSYKQLIQKYAAAQGGAVGVAQCWGLILGKNKVPTPCPLCVGGDSHGHRYPSVGQYGRTGREAIPDSEFLEGLSLGYNLSLHLQALPGTDRLTLPCTRWVLLLRKMIETRCHVHSHWEDN